MNKFISLIFLAILSTSAVFPQKVCTVDAWIEDNDPKGLNVRKEASSTGQVLTRLIKGQGDITLNVLAGNGKGWVQITNADNDGSILFSGKGWVFASMLATGTKGSPNYNSPSKLYSTPSKNGKKVATVPSEDVVTLLDCSGDWAKVSYKGKAGWLAPENQCASPYTTCN